LPEPWLQYGDFAVWQRRALEGVFFEQQLEYWRRQLAEIPPDLKLPWDRQRPAGRNTPNTTLPFQLAASLCDLLKEFARREGATLVMVLMATYQSLLHRYSGQDELVVGTAVSGRDRRPVEAVVGLFENILAIRANLKGHPDYRAILRQTRTSLLEAYSNRELPFERIVDECKSRDNGGDPIFRTMFTFEESPLPEWHLGDLQAERMPAVNTYSRFDLVLNMRDGNSGLNGEFVYRPDVFDRRTIQGIAGRFQGMLQAVLENPELPISKIPLS
jgi:non-ribosomal peptide synthetase component F